MLSISFFFFNDTATTEIYTLSLHDALPIWLPAPQRHGQPAAEVGGVPRPDRPDRLPVRNAGQLRARQGRWARQRRRADRSEEHTSELQSRQYLVCRLLLEKKN